jgi:hypothetical protein
MTSVSEQLHQYRAMKAQDGAVPATDAAETLVMERSHPNTTDYFRNLMSRWQKDYLTRMAKMAKPSDQQ